MSATKSGSADAPVWMHEGCLGKFARGKLERRSRPHAMTIPLDDQGCPDLQALVRLRGKQYAESIGEKYDPEHCGGYQHISAQDWAEWDRAEWQHRCHIGLAK